MRIEFDASAHAYTVDGRAFPAVGQILEAAGLKDMRWADEAAMRRGAFVHEAIQYYNEGTLDWTTLDPRLMPYVAAYKLFRHESGFEPVAFEEPLASATYSYAGTPDAWGLLHGKRIVLDFKSGSIPVYTRWQLAAYAQLVFERTTILYERAALLLREDGKYSLVTYTDRRDWTVFQAALTLYHARAEAKLLGALDKKGGNGHGAV